MKISNDSIGQVGESIFRAICKSNNYIVNKSDDDQSGWDFEIEILKDEEFDYNCDSKIIFKVQVKTTKSAKISAPLTYSNILNLVRYRGPSVLVLIKLDNDNQAEKINLKHIDKSVATNLFKSIREKDVGLKSYKINKTRKVLRVDDISCLVPFAEGINKYLLNVIACGYDEYCLKKISWFKAIDKQRETKEIDMVFKSRKDIEGFADCLIGLNSNFRVDTVMFNSPFGLRDCDPSVVSTGTNPKLSPNHDLAPNYQLTFECRPGNFSATFLCKYYATPPEIPQEFAKMRFASDLFDAIYKFSTNEFSFEIINFVDDGKDVRIDEYLNMLMLLKHSTKSEELAITFASDKSEPLFLEVPNTLEIDESMLLSIEYFECFCRHAHKYRILKEKINTSSLYNSLSHFHLLTILNTAPNESLYMKFESDNYREKERYDAVLFKSSIEYVGGFLVTACLFYGFVKQEGDSLIGCFDRIKTVDQYISSTDEDDELWHNVVKTVGENYEYVNLKVLV